MRICDAGKRAKFWQAGHRPGNVPGLPCGRAPGADVSPVVLTIDAGQLGKLVIDLASAGASPRPCPCCRRSTPASSKGKLTAGKAVIDLASAGPSRGRVCVADDRRRPVPRASRRRATRQGGHRSGNVPPVVSMIDAGKLVIVPPVVPMIDGGKLTAGKAVIVPPVVPTCRACRRSTAGKRAESGARRSST